MQTAGSMHVPDPAPEPTWQSASAHCWLLVHVPPSGRLVVHVGVAELLSQNVLASKQRVAHGSPRPGVAVHLFVVASHG